MNARTQDLPAAMPQSAGSTLQALNDWIAEVAALTRPDAIHWCDGSDAENDALVAAMEADGTLIRLNEQANPQSWLHRSHPDDVARVEHLTLVCTPEREDAGPNNHWMAPAEAHAKIDALFDGCMQGRTMYVIPYCMGPIDSPLSRCGVHTRVRCSTRATSCGSERCSQLCGWVCSLSRTRVPSASICATSAAFSASLPSHQWMASGRVSAATSATQSFSAASVLPSVRRVFTSLVRAFK